MGLESSLPENRKGTVATATKRVAELTEALQFARVAEHLLMRGENHIVAPDPSTAASARVTVRLLQQELADAERHLLLAKKYEVRP